MAKNHAYRDEFESIGEFLATIVTAGRDLGTDVRLEYAAEATGAGEVIPSAGGFLVPVEHASELHERVYETGALLSRVTRWPATKEKFTIPLVDETSRADGSRFGGVTMAFTEPGGEITASKPKFAEREINRRALKGVVHVTNELMADVPTLEAVFMRLYGLEGAFVIENEIVNGGGAIGPLGILNSGAVISIAKESGQAAATIVAENVVKMFARLWAPSKRRAVWLVNSDVIPQLYTLTLASGTALVPLFKWGDNGEPLLMGRPVLETEYSATLGTVGDIILADLGEYLIGDPEETTIRFSADLKFVTDEGSFRVVMRVDGHPAWSSPTTPLNGTATVSPFISLATRA